MKNLNPVYQENFFLAAPFATEQGESTATMIISVMDWDKMSADDVCGEAIYKIHLSELAIGQTKDVELPLSPSGGTIYFSITRHERV
jgi:Ca2+-dependent lipid-binding protein